MTAAAAAAAGFVQVERRTAEPMLPLDLFRGNAAARVSVIAALHNVGIYGQLFAAGLFLQRVLGFTPLRAGMVLLPMTAAIALLAFVSGRWIARSGPYPPLNTGHAVATAGSIGLASLAALGNGASTPLLLLFLTAGGVGAGLASPPMTTALLAVLPQERSGLAGGVLNTSGQIGNMFGIAVIGAVITSFGGVGSGAGYVASWLLAASALGTNVVLGVMLALNKRQQHTEVTVR